MLLPAKEGRENAALIFNPSQNSSFQRICKINAIFKIGINLKGENNMKVNNTKTIWGTGKEIQIQYGNSYNQ